MIHLSTKAFRHQRRGFLGLTDILHYVNAPSRHKCIPREPNPQFLHYRHVLPWATGTMYVSLYLYALLSTVCLVCFNAFPRHSRAGNMKREPVWSARGFSGPSFKWMNRHRHLIKSVSPGEHPSVCGSRLWVITVYLAWEYTAANQAITAGPVHIPWGKKHHGWFS